jgi:hypothetical protein
MCHAAFSVILCIPFLLVGCGSKELTRPKAAELINNEYFKQANIEKTAKNLTVRTGSGHNYIIHDSESNTLMAVQRAGLFSVQLHPGVFLTSGNVSITEKGRALSREWKEDRSRVKSVNLAEIGPIWIIPTQRQKFLEVTGITTQSPTTAVTEFKWQWIRTESGKALGITEDTVVTSTAQFQLYDDGWRIMARSRE